MVGSGPRHRAAGLIPEGRPSGPRPSAVSRTTGSDAPRWPDLHADATQPATGHLALPVLSLPFPVSPMSRCEDVKIQKTLRF